MLRVRFEILTRREREIMAFVVTGRNKQVAYDMGISENKCTAAQLCER